MKYILIMTLVLSGCVREPSPNVNVGSEVSLGTGLYRKEDKEYGVVCYMYYDKGLSCLKITDGEPQPDFYVTPKHE